MAFKKNEYQSGRDKYNYWKSNYEAIRSELLKVDWDSKLQEKDGVEEMWTVFQGEIMKMVEEHVPKKGLTRRIKRKNPWINNRTRRKMKDRATAWKKYRSYQSEQNYREYKVIRNEVNKLVRTDQMVYQKKLLNKRKRKALLWIRQETTD